jgi:hypothetical protein
VTFPQLRVSVGCYGSRSDVVFKDANWRITTIGSLVVYAAKTVTPMVNGQPAGESTEIREEIGQFSPGSNWAVVALDANGETIEPFKETQAEPAQ